MIGARTRGITIIVTTPSNGVSFEYRPPVSICQPNVPCGSAEERDGHASRTGTREEVVSKGDGVRNEGRRRTIDAKGRETSGFGIFARVSSPVHAIPVIPCGRSLPLFEPGARDFFLLPCKRKRN